MIKVVPDLHADPGRLHRSLAAKSGDARIAFLGDLIDAGPRAEASDDFEVLTTVRTLVEQGNAVTIMGNHELNAILFHRTDSDGQPLRAHTGNNRDQHQSFIERFGIGTSEALYWTSWFLKLPLWVEVEGLRLVHACWNDDAVAVVAERRPDGRLQLADLPEIAGETTPFGRAVKLLVSGPEATLPDGRSFLDSRQHRRTEVRLAWWRAGGRTWRDVALSVSSVTELPPDDLPPSISDEIYPQAAPPVLVGHYKLSGIPRIEAPNAASLDYPDCPCVYLWRGGSNLTNDNILLV
ncbi:metallophosphoesterase [Rhizobium arsenicireducens]